MALSKRMELESGIVLNYHRIVSINKITNNETIIEVSSYTGADKREIERQAIEHGEPFDVHIHTIFFNKQYNETDTIEDLYDYLKTLEMFENAEDC